MKHFLIGCACLFIGFTVGNKVGWMSATDKFTREDRIYGCKVWQQAPNGDCP